MLHGSSEEVVSRWSGAAWGSCRHHRSGRSVITGDSRSSPPAGGRDELTEGPALLGRHHQRPISGPSSASPSPPRLPPA